MKPLSCRICLIAGLVATAAPAWAQGCTSADLNAIAQFRASLAAGRMNDATGIARTLSPSCRNALNASPTVTPMPPRPYAPPSPMGGYSGGGSVIMPGTGGCTASGCYVR